MKRILDEKGKGSYEFLTVVVVCLILASILLVLAIRNGEKEKREVFRYNARTIGINAIDYEYRKASSIVYLYELIDEVGAKPLEYYKGQDFGRQLKRN